MFAILLLFLILIPSVSSAGFEHESILTADIDSPILDVTASADGDLIFVLTPGSVLIYSTGNQTVMSRIPLDNKYDHIAYQNDDRLVITATKPSQIKIVSYSRIYNIDLTERAMLGSPEAKVTLVVFDDYQ